MPALYLFGKRTLLGGDDLHVPALAAVLVRLIQLAFFVLPLGIYIWKQAVDLDDALSKSSGGSGSLWPVGRYLWDWWGLAEDIAQATAAQENNGSYGGPPDCVKSFFARYYPLLSALHLFCTVLFCFHSLWLESRIWHWSCRGTPTMRQPRTKNVQELMEKKLGIWTVLLALIVGGTYLFAALFFARPYHRCFDEILDSVGSIANGGGDDDDATGDASSGSDVIIKRWVGSSSWYALGALLALSQTAEVVIAALFCLRLRRAPTSHSSVTMSVSSEASRNPSVPSQLHAIHHELIEELWADRCESLFRCLSVSTCFLFGGRDLMDNAQQNNSYKHVAQALADYLETKGTLDVVPTDLFTGLFVLQRIQRQRILQTRRSVYEESLLASSVAPSSNRNGGFAARETAQDATVGTAAAPPTSSELSLDNSSKSIDNNYHQISSPQISQTGLRSRVASSNDLRNRGGGSSQSLSPPGKPKPTMVAPHSMMPNQDSSLIRPPAPPSQHLQQIQGLRQQHQQRILRRNHPWQRDDSELLASPNRSNSDISFYRATTRQVLIPGDPLDASILEEGARMCKYSLSIYTWMLYVFVHPVTGFPRLVCRCGSEKGMASCCRACCSEVCGVWKDRSNHGSSSNDSSPSQHPLYSPPGTTPANPPMPISMAASRHSSEGSDNIDADYPIGEDQFPDNNREAGSFTSGDNFCEWHKRALLLVAGIPEADLVYAQFNNKLSTVPYCILVDHERSLVVLSIRGSLSLEDVVTDTLVLPESLEEIGNRYGFDGRGQYCHAGVLACFQNVLRDLQKHGWLERLLESEYPDYSLRIVGHSLGAGVSTLLGYVLRSRYPSLKVYGFSPPGCTMTWDIATACESWVTTFILDSDIVPRLSVFALEELRDEVLALIGRIKVPKYEVFQKFLKRRESQSKGCLFGASGIDTSSEDFEDDLDELTQIINETLDEIPPDTIYQRQLQDFLRVQNERKASRGETNSKDLRLYPPGKMIHLVRTGEESGISHMVNQCLTCCTGNSGFVYTPVYISNDDLDEIVVTATMGTDHFIDRMCDELHTLSDRFLDTNSGMESMAAYPCGVGSSSV